jgi:NAD(P)-dependent dehydrogenase (short-subunit alcohol dehydrogenase family)
MSGLKGKVILITGASGNLGGAAAERALAAGARVAVTDRAAANLKARFSDGADVALYPGVELADAASCADYVAQTSARFGRVDGLISTVGGFAFTNVADDTYATWERMLTMNVKTAFHVSQAALPAMRAAGGGSIVLTGATAALKAPAGVAAYAASKSGVMRLAESLANEVKGDGIRVNAVMPSIIDTPQNREAMPDADRTGWVTPEEIADVMLFLVSDAARAVTGALIPVTGKG